MQGLFVLKSLFFKLTALGAFLLLAATALMPSEGSQALEVSGWLAALLLSLMFVPGSVARVLFTTLCAWVVIRYLGWRFTSLPLHKDLITSISASLLLVAEVYGCAMLLLGLVVNALPLTRKTPPLPRNKEDYPVVDVFIPTYSEPISVVAPTVMAALEIDYPKDKLNVYILDDGYPKSLALKDTTQGKFLADRTTQLKELALKHGAKWLSRPDNSHAKSGNLNEALKFTSGEYILVLDADHVPTKNILKNMVGFLTRDSEVAFVQSPHFFLNPDPVERNLGLHQKIPGENDMFYRVIQKGLDLWNTSFFCGSAALLRRKAIESIGGFSTSSITEDASSSISMHQLGWKSAYQGIPMVAGLQPETFAGFIVQRLRWSMGMIQIWIKQNPWLIRGLTLGQRISYTSVILFWLFPIARIIFFIAPLLSIFFNITVYPVGVEYFLAYTTPYILAVFLSFNRLFGKVRAFLISELYETVQSFYILPAILTTILSPSAPTFKVTPKGVQTDTEYVSEFKGPLYTMFAITAAALLWGVYRMFTEEESRAALSLSVTWIVFNTVLLLGGLGVIFEKPQRRERPRINLDLPVKIDIPELGTTVRGVVENISESGALLMSNEFPTNLPGTVIVHIGQDAYTCSSVNARADKLKKGEMAVRFEFSSPEQERQIITLAYGDSDKWMSMWQSRESSLLLPVVLVKMAYIFTKKGIEHLKHLYSKDE